MFQRMRILLMLLLMAVAIPRICVGQRLIAPLPTMPPPPIRNSSLHADPDSRSVALFESRTGERVIGARRRPVWLLPSIGAAIGGLATAALIDSPDCEDCMFSVPRPIYGILVGAALGVLVEINLPRS